MNVNEIASLGSNVKSVIQNENCAVLMLNDATGEGVMTVYRVMPGVMICFSDMYMEQCASEFYLYSFVAYLYELESGAVCVLYGFVGTTSIFPGLPCEWYSKAASLEIGRASCRERV